MTKTEKILPGALGVALISFDRPDYLSQLILSLESQTSLQGVQFYLFQDGARNKFSKRLRGDQSLIDQCMEIFKRSRLPSKDVFYHKDNVGIAINQFMAWEHVLQRHKYMLMIEDDQILSPHCLRLIKLMLRQFEFSEQVGSVRAPDRPHCQPEDNEKYLDAVCQAIGHWWVVALWRDRWERVKPLYMDYYKMVKDIDYQLRAHGDIREFYRAHGWTSRATSQDGGKEMAFWRAGYKHLAMVVNRSKTIGERGVHQSPGLFKKMGFDKIKLTDYPQDEKIVQFKAIPRPLGEKKYTP